MGDCYALLCHNQIPTVPGNLSRMRPGCAAAQRVPVPTQPLARGLTQRKRAHRAAKELDTLAASVDNKVGALKKRVQTQEEAFQALPASVTECSRVCCAV